MRISVIIPALDERDVIGGTVDRARLGDPCEIIVVDGGSVDGTPEAAEARGARVVTSPPGRGRQMNTASNSSPWKKRLWTASCVVMKFRKTCRTIRLSRLLARSGGK